MKVKFERIYNYNGNEYRILIDRMWPRGITKDKIDFWFKEIAPSKELNANAQKVNELISMINSKPCVLLYSSKNEKNNSTVLKEYLEQ